MKELTFAQLRDLRILDPALATSYPSAILCRDRAIVVNLETLKCIITADAVYVMHVVRDLPMGLSHCHTLDRHGDPASSPPTPSTSCMRYAPVLKLTFDCLRDAVSVPNVETLKCIVTANAVCVIHAWLHL